MRRRKLISIVTPCFNEEDNVAACYEAVRTIFTEQLADYGYEHVFADNASTDGTVAILRSIAAKDPNVRLIVNARNYGPFRSTFNALKAVTGDAVLAMLPADLQDPPGLLPTFVHHWEAGFKIVYGVRTNREEGWIMRAIRRLYYRAVRTFANIDIPENAAEFQLLDRQVLDALKRFDDSYPYLRGMIANCGFRALSKAVPYTWHARKRGISKNRLYHLIDQGLNGLISFTNVPLRLCTVAGFALASLAILYALIQLLINLVTLHALAPPGTPTLIVALFFFAGIQLFFMGLLGEYIAAIHSQVRDRGVIIEQERINFDLPREDTAKPG